MHTVWKFCFHEKLKQNEKVEIKNIHYTKHASKCKNIDSNCTNVLCSIYSRKVVHRVHMEILYLEMFI